MSPRTPVKAKARLARVPPRPYISGPTSRRRLDAVDSEPDRSLFSIYMWIVIAVVMSWLIAFNIVNRHNDIVRQISYVLYRLTEPVLGPIRRVLPDMGGLDLSPIVVFIAI